MVTPNWYYFATAPLDSGTTQFRTKTERALHARVIACEMNWKDYQTSNFLDEWITAKNDLEIYQTSLLLSHNS